MLVLAAWLVMPLAMAQQTAELAAKTTGAQTAEPVRRVVGPTGKENRSKNCLRLPRKSRKKKKNRGWLRCHCPGC